jgi:hypothetical protein
MVNMFTMPFIQSPFKTLGLLNNPKIPGLIEDSEAKDNRHVKVMRWIRDNMFDAGISDGSWGAYFVNTINKDIEEIEK